MLERFFNTQDALGYLMELLQKYVSPLKIEVKHAYYTTSIYVKVFKPKTKTIYQEIRISDHPGNREIGYDIDISTDEVGRNNLSKLENIVNEIVKTFKIKRGYNA